MTVQQALIPQEKKDKFSALLAQLESLKTSAHTLGMVNDDEKIDPSDALLILQRSVKRITADGFPTAKNNQHSSHKAAL